MASVGLKNINKYYGDYHATRDVSFTIEDGEFVVFVGPSGCGKSTVLRLIAGLEEITDGELYFDDDLVNNMPPAKRGIGMVFQSYALYPHMTVADNIGFGLKLAKIPKAEREARVLETAKILQLDHLLDRKPSDMSGGQRQRVAIGRAIVRNPRVFLFDEPLSNLDASLRVQMRLEIGRLHRELKATMIYVTHDQVEAMTLADRIVVLEAGQVRQIGSPMELYEHPANKFVAGFIGSPKMNFLDATLAPKDGGNTTLLLANGQGTHVDIAVPGLDQDACKDTTSTVTLGIRPEHCSIGPADATGGITGTIRDVEKLGSDTFVYIDVACAAEPITARLQENTPASVGDQVTLKIDTDKCYAFDEAGESLQTRPA